MNIRARLGAWPFLLSSLGISYAVPTALAAQSTWEALLTIDPFPSPYYSDWEANPNIASLSILNHGPADGTVRVVFSIVDQTNRVVAQGTSEPQFVGAGTAAIFDSPYDIEGTTSHDPEIERFASRTGRLPEGEYTACAAATDTDGFILAEACLGFSVFYPDPPLLLEPFDGAVLESQDAFFQWTPVQVPADQQPQYVLRVAEVLRGQTPAEALTTNIPHLESTDLFNPMVQYPLEATPLEPGKTYAWTVRAFDANGYPVSANDGQSEIWTFSYDDGATPASPAGMSLTLSNDPISMPSIGPSDAGLSDICKNWSTPPLSVTVGMNIPLGFVRQAIELQNVTLYQDQGDLTWVILGRRDNREYLISGDCDRGGFAGGLRWIASRRIGLGQPLSEFLGLDSNVLGDLGLDYAVTIVALGEETVSVPSSWDGPNRFLDGHEIDVGTGINLFGVLDLSDAGSFFDALGFPDASLELYGRLGPQTEWSIGGGTGGTFGGGDSQSGSDADIDVDQGLVRERELLRLEARLPEKTPPIFGGLFETSQWGFEIVLEDSRDMVRNPANAVGVSFSNVTTELTLGPTLTLVTRGGTEIRGGLGGRAGLEHQAVLRWLLQGGDFGRDDPENQWVLSLTSDYELELGSSGFFIGEPEVEVTLDAELIRAYREGTGVPDVEIELEGILGHEEMNFSARAVLGFGRAAAKSAADIAEGSQSKMDSIRANIERLETEIRSAEAADSTARVDALSTTLAIERNALAMWEAKDRMAAAAPDSAAAPPSTPGQWTWKAGVYLGNVSIGDLLADLRTLVMGALSRLGSP